MFFVCMIRCVADVSSVSPSSEQTATIITEEIRHNGYKNRRTRTIVIRSSSSVLFALIK